jgi:uncharacterized damage-inducible protein DinB
MEFRSRAVQSLVELHEVELRSFLETWKRFVASGLPMPDAHGDESYASRDSLGGHVLMSARGYLTRVGEWVERPVTDVDAEKDAGAVVKRAPQFMDEVLAAYRRHLPAVTTEEFEPQKHRTRWGDLMSVEMLLEHAVVHPMRHRIQLERILAAGQTAKA